MTGGIKRAILHPVTVLILRVFLGGLFIYACIDKMGDPAKFADIVARFEMLPDFLVNPLAIVLPWVELWAGIFLVLGYWTRPSASILTGLLLMFLVALVAALITGKAIDCGCFTVQKESPVSIARVLEDLGMILMALPPLLAPPGRLSLEGLIQRVCRDSKSLSDQTPA